MDRTSLTFGVLLFCMTGLARLVPGVMLYEVIYSLGTGQKLGVSQARFPLQDIMMTFLMIAHCHVGYCLGAT